MTGKCLVCIVARNSATEITMQHVCALKSIWCYLLSQNNWHWAVGTYIAYQTRRSSKKFCNNFLLTYIKKAITNKQQFWFWSNVFCLQYVEPISSYSLSKGTVNWKERASYMKGKASLHSHTIRWNAGIHLPLRDPREKGMQKKVRKCGRSACVYLAKLCTKHYHRALYRYFQWLHGQTKWIVQVKLSP